MCCIPLAGNAGRKKSPNVRHLGTIAQICRAMSLQLRYAMTIGKNLLKINISSTCPYNMVNFGSLTAEIRWRVSGTPANFNGFRVLASLHAATSLNGGQPNFARCLDVSWTGTLCIHFPGLLPRNGILPRATFTLLPSLTFFCWQRYCTALLHGTPAAGVSQTLGRGTRNGITELSHHNRLGGHHVGHQPTF